MDAPKDITGAPQGSGVVPEGKRDVKGRFGAGNNASAGSKRTRQKCVMLREAALGSATLEMAIEAMVKLHALGMLGDVKALCEWLNRVGCRPELMGMDDEQMEEFAIRVIERVWGPAALAKNASNN